MTLSPAVPMPPVWIGGTSDAALVRTVTHGCGWLAAMLTPDELAHHATRLTALAGQRGVPSPRIGAMIFAGLTERDSKTAAAPVASYLTVIVPFGPDVLTQYDLIAQARSHLLGA